MAGAHFGGSWAGAVSGAAIEVIMDGLREGARRIVDAAKDAVNIDRVEVRGQESCKLVDNFLWFDRRYEDVIESNN